MSDDLQDCGLCECCLALYPRIKQLREALDGLRAQVATLEQAILDCSPTALNAPPPLRDLPKHLRHDVGRLTQGHADLEAQVATLTQERDKALADGPDGTWICQTCGFVAQKFMLRATDMAVGIDRRDVQDVCPNDGTSLRRKTWKEDALDSDRVGREQMKRAVQAEQEHDEAQRKIAAVRVIQEMLAAMVVQAQGDGAIEGDIGHEARWVAVEMCVEELVKVLGGTE